MRSPWINRFYIYKKINIYICIRGRGLFFANIAENVNISSIITFFSDHVGKNLFLPKSPKISTFWQGNFLGLFLATCFKISTFQRKWLFWVHFENRLLPIFPNIFTFRLKRRLNILRKITFFWNHLEKTFFA